MSNNKTRQVEINGRHFSEYPCLCGSPDCVKTLAVANGVTHGTITLGIREHGCTLSQSYLDSEQARILSTELRSFADRVHVDLS